MIVRAGIANVEEQLMKGVIGSELGKKFWRRVKSFPDFTGGAIELLDYDTQVADELNRILTTKGDLKCSLIRFATQKHGLLPGWKDLDYRNDLLKCFRVADHEMISQLPEHLVSIVTYLNRLDKYYDLVADSESSKPAPVSDNVLNDAHARRYSENVSFVEKSVRDAFLEKNVKNPSSLETPSVLDKVWKEIDASARKIGRTKKLNINKIEDFVVSHVQPRWIVAKLRSRLVPSPESTGAEPEGRGEPSVESASSAANIKPVGPVKDPRSKSPEKLPADIKPYNSSRPSESITTTDKPKREGLKVKTRPSPSSSTPKTSKAVADGQQTDRTTLAQDLKLPFFHVPKHVFNTFEVIFDPKVKGNLSWQDVVSALTNIGMRYDHLGGSECRFTPTGGKLLEFLKSVLFCAWAHTMSVVDIAGNIPLLCHQPHGRDPTKLGPFRIRALAKNMSNSYGWTKEWFGLKNKTEPE
ncbi:hypothetical protein K435DRAFT_863247 [Dendrothele bispora CBS 962.96]|uniref:Uncharacterized protein n=1 Tax=Dendrothele bispora (strain CBS 962.96) TaxID=1314807 RepID=A0A4S8LQT8_DENBC|nr:hypothetical protein K435DRAFT_863247 [Dendrothele bispora CBS 962.96]